MNFPSDIWVAALIRRANNEGAFAVVTRKGDPRAGAILVRVWNSRASEMRIYAEALNAKGESVWIEPVSATAEADFEAYVQRSIRVDPDIWIVDIEDVTGRHFLVEPVEKR